MLVRELRQGVLELPRSCTPSVSHHCKGTSVVRFSPRPISWKSLCAPVFLYGLLQVGASGVRETTACNPARLVPDIGHGGLVGRGQLNGPRASKMAVPQPDENSQCDPRKNARKDPSAQVQMRPALNLR